MSNPKKPNSGSIEWDHPRPNCLISTCKQYQVTKVKVDELKGGKSVFRYVAWANRKSQYFADGDLISVEVSGGSAMLVCEDDKKRRGKK